MHIAQLHAFAHMGSSPKLIVENIRYQTQHDIAIVRLGGRAVGEGLIHVPTLNVCDAPAHALRDGELASWLSSPSTRIGRTEKSSDVLLAQAEGSDEQPARWVQRLLAQVAGCPLEK